MKNKRISRRSFFAGAGTLGAASLFPLGGWAKESGGKRIILVQADGGWDTTFCLNPRLSSSAIDGPDQFSTMQGVDREEIVDFGNGGPDTLKVMINDAKRASVTTFFDNFASNSIIVNGIYTSSLVHEACRYRMITGTRSNESPDIGMIGGLLGSSEYAVPYLDLGGAGLFGTYSAMTLQLGRSNQIIAHLDRERELPGPRLGVTYPGFVPATAQQSAIEDFLLKRQDRLVGAGFGGASSVQRIADYREALDRKERVLVEAVSGGLLDQIEFGSTPGFGNQAELAVSLMSAGLCHSVGLDSGVSWDTHNQLEQQNELYKDLFLGLLSLSFGLKQVPGLWEETIVVVLSEMTRKPRMNTTGGKDHWPSTSALVFGGGISGGRTLGGSDAGLNALNVNLSSGLVDSSSSGSSLYYSSFVAGLAHAVGQDPAEWFPHEEVLHGIVD